MPKNEKLILKEPETSLNEDLERDNLKDFVYEVNQTLKSICRKYNGVDARDMRLAWDFFRTNYNFGGGDDYDESLKETYDDYEDISFDEWIKQYDHSGAYERGEMDDDEIDRYMDDYYKRNESLEEALPKDLSLAYKNAHSVGADRSRRGQRQDKERGYGRINQGKVTNAEYDFFNSDYREITPEEAIQLRKEGKVQNIRAIFDGQLVTFDEKGRQTSGTYSADRNGSLDDKWKSPNGNYIDRTNALSFNNVIQRADKIYYTEEKPYDYEKMRARKENPESRYGIKSFGSSDLVDYSSRSKSRVDDPSGDYNYGNNQYLNAESEWKKYQEIINDPDSSDWEKERAKDRSRHYARRMDIYKDDRERYLRKEKDAKARRRYYTSEVELQKPFVELERLRSDLDSAQSSVNYAERNYRDMKKNGSPNVVTYKNKLIDAKKQLAEYKRKVAKYEVLLQDAEDENDAELQKAEQEVLKYQQQLEQTQSELDKLMRRG